MQVRDLCAHCMRPVWRPDLDGAITISVCTGWKSDRCELVKNNRDLGTALALLLRDQSEITRESVRALLHVVEPGVIAHRCPHCDSPYVVRDGTRCLPHYPSNTASKLCMLSFKTKHKDGVWR